jgi:ribose transport system substrate-binding protein
MPNERMSVSNRSVPLIMRMRFPTISLVCLLVIVAGLSRSPANAAERNHLLMVQPLRNHPVTRIMQAGFLNRCRELGDACEVVGNASATSLDVSATIALAEAALARQRFSAVGVFALDQSIYPFISKLSREGLPVVTWHVVPPVGTVPGLSAATGEDVTQVGYDVATAMGQKLAGVGAVAITQGSFNVEENTKAAAFARSMRERFPKMKLLEPQLEGFEPSTAKSKAISLLQGHPEITGVFSTTGNGAQTWAGAARAVDRKLVIIGMDYIRQNLDLVRAGEVYGLVAQPLYEEGARAAELASALARGTRVSYVNVLPAKVITVNDLQMYYAILAKAQQ